MAKKERSLQQLWISVLTTITALQFGVSLLKFSKCFDKYLNLVLFNATKKTMTRQRLPPYTCMIGNMSINMPRDTNFFIIGDQKSETTYLFNYLLHLPDIVPTWKHIRKKSSEVQFFDTHCWKKVRQLQRRNIHATYKGPISMGSYLPKCF